MRSVKGFFSKLLRDWAERLERKPHRSILKKSVGMSRWVVVALVAVSILFSLISEFGFERRFIAASLIFVVFWLWLAWIFLELQPVSDSKFLLVSVMIILSVIVTQSLAARGIPKYYVFAPLAASIICFLASRRSAVASVILISLIVALIYRGDFEIFFISLAGGLGAVSFPKRVLKRGDLFLNGLSIFIFLFASSGIMRLFAIQKGSFLAEAVQAPLLVAASTSILALAFFFVFLYF